MNRFWRGVAIFVLGGVLGTGFGVALGFFIFPYVFPPPPAAEQLTDSERSKLVASGSFIHANPSDPVHYGKGRVSVYDRPMRSYRVDVTGFELTDDEMQAISALRP